MNEVGVIRQGPGRVVATFRNVIITHWAAEAEVPFIDAATEMAPVLAKRFPAGIGIAQVVAHQGKPPDEAARQAFVRQMKASDPFVKASAVVYEGGGLRASLVRGVLTSLLLVARMRNRFEITDGTAQAARWLCSSLEAAGCPCGSAAELEAAFTHVRRLADGR